MNELLANAGVVPVVVLESAEDAVPVATALRDGGLPVIEVTLRTAAATEAIRRIADQVPDISIGAGTVLDDEQVGVAADAGARFIVSPGLHEPVVDEAQSRELPVYPGVSTATEAQAAWNLGLRTLKFFPAVPAGGVPMLKALSSVFRDLQFMPTGGVTASNLVDFLQLPSVIACGGSWLTPAQSIAAQDYGAIRQLAEQARALVMDLNGSGQ